MRTPPGERPPLGDDVLVIGPGSELNAPETGGGAGTEAHPGSLRRIALAVGLLLCLFMLVVSFVEQNATNTFIFGVGTIALFVVLGMTSRRR
jgi:hypothetical protein